MFYSVALYLNFCGRVSHLSQELTDLTQLASQVPLVSSISAFYVPGLQAVSSAGIYRDSRSPCLLTSVST